MNAPAEKERAPLMRKWRSLKWFPSPYPWGSYWRWAWNYCEILPRLQLSLLWRTEEDKSKAYCGWAGYEKLKPTHRVLVLSYAWLFGAGMVNLAIWAIREKPSETA